MTDPLDPETAKRLGVVPPPTPAEIQEDLDAFFRGSARLQEQESGRTDTRPAATLREQREEYERRNPGERMPQPSPRPGAVNVRLVCPPDVMNAALASLTDFYGDAWQPSTRKPSRNADGHVLQYGTLIVPVPAVTQ